jgi:serine protease Do
VGLRRFLTAGYAGVALALAGAALGVGLFAAPSHAAATPTPVPAALAPVATMERKVGAMPSLAPLVKELKPGVVNIYTAQTMHVRRSPFGGHGSPFDPFFGFPGGGGGMPQEEDLKRSALGSGFLIGGGLVLTNNHVIDGADEIKVKGATDETWDATVVGRDPATDVAVLRLAGESAKKVAGVKLGDSDALEVGDYVVAIGNPLGLGTTVTSGIVSAKSRVINAGPYDDFIQTDASINPGNSGGPLFNLNGEVVGINTAIARDGQGIGFAVPINMVKAVLPQLEGSGHVSRGWLGLSLQELSPGLTSALGIPSGTRGALVAQVLDGSPAQKAGLREGDVIVGFNERGVDSPGALTRAVGAVAPKTKVALRLLRDGREQTLKLEVGTRPDGVEARAPAQGEEAPDAKPAGSVGLGVDALPEEVARRAGVAPNAGVLVTTVVPGSVAELAGVREGDVLVALQKRPVTSPQGLRAAAAAVKPGEPVMFQVRRGGNSLFLAAQAQR